MMKRFYWLVTLVVLAVAAGTVQAESADWSPSMVGVGAHGYDWQIGNWSCTNSMPPSPMNPTNQTGTVTRANGSGLFFHFTGKNYDYAAYDVYVAKMKTWLGPIALGDGSYGSESTNQTGAHVVWTGRFYSATGAMTQIRDTDAVSSSTKFTDLGEYQSGDGTWKKLYYLTCTKT